MTKSLIKLTGVPQKPPQITAKKDALLLFKTDGTADDAKAVSYFRVSVKKQIWGRVAKSVTPTTYYIIEGIPEASVTAKGAPFVSVSCLRIYAINGLIKDSDSPEHFLFPGDLPEDTEEVIPLSSINIPDNFTTPKAGSTRAVQHFQKHNTFTRPLRVKKDTMTLVTGYPEYLLAKDLKIKAVPVSYNLLTGAPSKDESKLRNVHWYEKEEVKEMDVSDIVLTEDIHLNVQNVVFKLNLKEYSDTRCITTPIAVRPVEDGRYSLVIGAARYYVAKILDIQKIPAVLTDLKHDEFVEERFAHYAPSQDQNPDQNKQGKRPRSVEAEIPIDAILIPDSFARTKPNPMKIQDTIAYYTSHGKFDKPVIIRGDDNLLIDGYKRYVAAKEMGLETVWTRKFD
jgi:hypothetical protein